MDQPKQKFNESELIGLKVLDEINDYFYVSDVQTYELLYLNKKGTKKLKIESYQNKKCYKVMQGRDSPCPFCTTPYLNFDEFIPWKFKNPITKEEYLLRDKLIMWNDKPVRLEWVTNIDYKDLITSNIERKLKVEDTLIHAIRELANENNKNIAIHNFLKIISDFYHSSHTYIYAIDEKLAVAKIIYEWNAPNYSSTVANEIPLDQIDTILKCFAHQGEYIVPNFSKNKLNNTYKGCTDSCLGHCIAVPLIDNDKISGFVGVENPESSQDDCSLLRLIAYFLQADLKNREMMQKLIQLSYEDTLTGVGNRNHYIKYIDDINLLDLASIGIIYIDINGLKIANDKYGHAYGDKLILNVVEKIKTICKGDIFRVGGDEFVVIFKNIEHDSFYEIVKMLRKAINNPHEETVSIGSVWENNNIKILELISYADTQMYVNKQKYYSQIQDDEFIKKNIVSSLLESIKADHFSIYLQPKYDLNTKQCCGCEALIRGRDSMSRPILPSKFVPIYERAGAIRHIDLFVLKHVCQMLQRWKKSGYQIIPISVNFSRMTIMEDFIVEQITEICDEYNIEHEYIDIELTESIGVLHKEELLLFSKRIKERGFKLSLDDFGSQYSDFFVLNNLTFDTVKIDKRMVDDIVTLEKSRIFLKYIIMLCHDIGSICLAEGIETEEQEQLLIQYGCAIGQGFLFDQPIKCETFENKYLK